MPEQFLSAYDVSQILNVPYRSVIDWLNDEKLPGIKLGKNWRIPKGELRRWMDEKGMKRGVDYVW
jgi:excisionase family DNA binding protein